MSTNTSNMNLVLPTPGGDNGTWGQELNTSLTTIDAHDHTPGKGVPIRSTSISITTDFDLNSQNLNNVSGVRLNNFTATKTGTQDVRELYSINGDLYYNNAAGTAVQVTQGSSVSTPTSTVVPAGSLIMYGGIFAPSGWLTCDGSAVSRTTYSTLFAAIGTNFGSGDGSTTFNLPNFNGRAPIGVGAYTDSGTGGAITRTIGQTVGEAVHTLNNTELPSHNHSITDPSHHHRIFGNSGGALNILGPLQSGIVAGIGAGGAQAYVDTGPQNPGTIIESSATGITGTNNFGGGSYHNNMQPSLGITFIIKY